MSALHILIPAAGAARRMRGRDKLLEPVDGVALLRRVAGAAAGAGPDVLWVTLQPGAVARRTALEGTAARLLEVPDWAEGLSASLRAGARAAEAAGASGMMIVLADMPELEAADLARLVRAHDAAPETVLRAAAEDGTPGHPVVLPARLFGSIRGLSGDDGARTLLAGETVIAVPLPGRRAVTDLDTPEAWAEWRARTGL